MTAWSLTPAVESFTSYRRSSSVSRSWSVASPAAIGLGVRQPSSVMGRPGAEDVGPERHTTAAVDGPNDTRPHGPHADSATDKPGGGVDGEIGGEVLSSDASRPITALRMTG